MCEKTPKDKLISASVTMLATGANMNSMVTIEMDVTMLLIQKKRITDQFSEKDTLYFNVIADMTLQPPNVTDEEDHEHYRFIYF